MRTRERLVSRFRRGYSSRCRWALEVQPAFAKFKESTRNVEQSRANAATACMHAGSVGFGRSMARITLKSLGRWGGAPSHLLRAARTRLRSMLRCIALMWDCRHRVGQIRISCAEQRPLVGYGAPEHAQGPCTLNAPRPPRERMG